MPEFPDQFTAATSVATTDYVFVNQTKATVSQIGQALGTVPLVQWNGTDTAQFGSAQSFGGVVTPTLTYVSSSTAASGVLRLAIGAASPALSGAVFWLSDTVDFQSMRIRYGVSTNGTIPIQAADDLYVGIVIAGDATLGSSVSHVIKVDGGGTADLIIGGNDAFATSAFSDVQAITAVTYSIVEWAFNGQLANAAGFPTNGVPALSGITDIIATGATARQSFLYTITSASGWNVSVGGNDSNRIGIVVGTVGGCASAASLDLSLLSFCANPVGYP